MESVVYSSAKPCERWGDEAHYYRFGPTLSPTPRGMGRHGIGEFAVRRSRTSLNFTKLHPTKC
jgi:hypothetical protein